MGAKKNRTYRSYDENEALLLEFGDTRQKALDNLFKVLKRYPKQMKQLLNRTVKNESTTREGENT